MKNILLVSFLILFLAVSTSTLKADLIDINTEDDTKLRWYEDKVIYDGEVNANELATITGYGDESIDVDYFAGDTLRAVFACPDSTLRIFRSNNNGQTWLNVEELAWAGNITEPHIVHGTDSTYHVFVRYQTDLDILYTRGYRTSDDTYILGTMRSISYEGDTVRNYSVCTSRTSYHDYGIFVAYQQGRGGPGSDQLILTRSFDYGQTWSTPGILYGGGTMFPDIINGTDSTLYLVFLLRGGGDNNYYIMSSRSFDAGTTWPFTTIDTIQMDTFPKMRPQIAAAYDGSGDVWVIWPRQNLLSANQDWDLCWSWSQDSMNTWSAPAVVNSVVDSNEVLPSIALYDAYGSTSTTPYVSFIKSYYDWTGSLSVRTFEWEGSSWGADTCFSDSNAFLTRPISAFIQAGAPAIAYVGENAHNVYFDSWSNTSGIDEDNETISSDGKIGCTLDCSIITGTAILKYILPEKGSVDVSVVNLIGQTVSILDSGEKDAGEHTVNISAENLSQGIYFIVVEADSGQKGTAKITILK